MRVTLHNQCLLFAVRFCALALILALSCVPTRAAPSASELKISGDDARTELSIALDEELVLDWFLLRTPYRLVIEMPETHFVFDAQSLKARGIVESVRYGTAAQGRSRIILTSRKPFSVERVEVSQQEDAGGYALAVALLASDDAAFSAAMDERAGGTAKSDAAQAPVEPAPAAKPFTVVLDAGHGGFDGGAEGVNGTREKDVTLTFARELKGILSAIDGFNIVMTRDSDIFLRLDQRVKIAQEAGADLFISIHADSIRYKGLRGATVYTVSDRASDAESQALAERENLADQLAGGALVEDNTDVADILFEFVRRETQDYSIGVANDLVHELGNSIGVINNPHRHARFRVLRAPDVPSVLVELGYLSNEEDESSLLDPQWRARAVDSMASAIRKFAARKGVASAPLQR